MSKLDIENRMKYIYGGFMRKPLDRHAVLFESFHGKEISDSPLAMARALLQSPQAHEFRVYYSTDDATRDQKIIDAMGLKMKLVDIHSKDYAKALATCGFLVNNSSFPSYFIRRDGQRYLQTWHGTPLKTLGKLMPYDIETMYNVQHNFIQADRLLFPNEFTKTAIMRDYNLEDIYTGKVVMCGYPRNSIFKDARAGRELKEELGDEAYTTFAYMPTWRGQSNQDVEKEEYNAEVTGILEGLDAVLSDREKLYVNFHPIVQKDMKLGDYRHIEPFPEGVDKYEFLNSVDVLITDYSSVFFDYSITGKPVLLFTYDYDKYMADRGMYIDIRQLPFLQIDTIEELQRCIINGDYRKRTYQDNPDYTNMFLRYDRIDAANKMVHFLLDGDETDLTVEDYFRNRQREWRIAEYPDLFETEDLDEIAGKVDPERDIVVFFKNRFNEQLSEHMLKYYRNAFQYIFVTKSTPKTYYETLIDRRGDGDAEILAARDRRRFLGDLKIEGYAESTMNGKILKLETKGSEVHVKVRFPKSVGEIESVSLSYRSNMEEVVYPFDFTVEEKNGNWIVDARLDLAGRKLDGTFWDINVFARNAYGLKNLFIGFTGLQRKMLFTRNMQCDLGEYILFPHITLKGKLAFTHREKTPYDTTTNRIKEMIAVLVCKLGRPYWKKKKIWLVFEKFCSMAQDNGYYFFRYCMEQLPSSKNRNIYYIMDKNAPDWDKVAVYGRNTVPYMSLRHIIYNLAAEIYVGADSKRHLYTWRPKPNRISYAMRKKKIFFLQHGVTALKKVDSIFGVHGSSPMTYFTTTSKYEQDIVTKNFGYPPERAPITGFTRWDVLEDKSSPEEKIILLMPTWRAWLEEKTKEEFRSSDYFRQYSEFLQSRELADYITEKNVKLIFYIHPKFRDYLGEFNISGDMIEMIPFGSVPLNEIMMKCSMLITDYSSVCWDVYYQGKPVLFFQFDYDTYMENHGSYMDMEHELFGPRLTTHEELIEAIREKVESGFAEDENAKEKRSEYFAYIDDQNSKRTYEFLKKEGY